MNTNKVSSHRWLMSLLPMLFLLLSFTAKAQLGTFTVADATGGPFAEASGTPSFLITWDGLDGGFGEFLNLSYSGTANGSDHSGPATISIEGIDGATGVTVNVPLVNDNVVEIDETLILGISSIGGGGQTALNITDTGTATITSEDTARVRINGNSTGAESTNRQFTVSFFEAGVTSDVDVVVFFYTTDGTATAPSDYTALVNGVNTVTIPAGSTSATLGALVTVVEDAISERNETFTVTIAESNFNGRAITLHGTATQTTRTGTINNNDLSVVSIDAEVGDNYKVNEGGTIQFTVSMTALSDADVDVTFVTGDVVATALDSDFTSLDNTNIVTIPAGSLSATMAMEAQVQTTPDNKVEIDEDFSVTIAESDFYLRPGISIHGTNNTRTGRIINNDGAEVSVSTGMATTNEADGITFTISMTNPSDADVEVTFNTGNGTATLLDTDYEERLNVTATITAGGTSTTVIVATYDDDKVEANETFTGTISNINNNSRAVSLAAAVTGTATITNDDSAVINITGATIDENDGTLTFTVSMSNPSNVATTMTFNTADVTATAGVDYTAISGATVTFPAAGNNVFTTPADQTVEVTITGDNIVELTETFTGTISALNTNSRPTVTFTGAAVSLEATGTITNDDSSVISIMADANAAEGDPVQFTVSMTNQSDADVVVSFVTADGTATLADLDYTQLTGANLVTIPIGFTSATAEAAVATTHDTKYEANETFTVTIAENQFNGRAVTVHGTDNVRTGTINNNDPAPTVTLSTSSATITEDQTGTHIIDVIATLSNPSGVDVVVTLGITNQTSEGNGTDFTLASTTITVLAGSTSAFTTVTAIDDNIDDDNETFRIDITAVQDGTEVGDQFAVITIIDNDLPPVVTISPATASEGVGTMLMNVSLSHPSGADVTLRFSATNGTATVGTDLSGTIPEVTFTEAGMLLMGGLTQPISITILQDLIAEPNETFTVGISSFVGTLLDISSTGLGTINDDDTPPTITVANASGTEGPTGTVTFTVTLSNPSYQDIILDFSTTGGTAISGIDFVAVPTPSTFTFTAASMADGTLTQEVVVSILDDNIDEVASVDEQFAFNVAANAGNVATLGAISGATGSIIDDEGSPTVTVTAGAAAAEGTSQSFTVALSHPSDQAIVLNYTTVANGTPTSTGVADQSDFTATSGQRNFPALSTTPTEGAITVAHLADNIDEGADTEGAGETYSFNASFNSGAPIGAITNATGTIIDDDVAPAISFSNVGPVLEGNNVTFTFSITNGQVSQNPITLTVNTAGGTAISMDDFTAIVGGTVTFPALSSANQTVDVAALPDNIDEVGTSATETFTLNASQASGYTLTSLTASAIGTIQDNTASPTLIVSDPVVVELDEGQTNLATFTIGLTGPIVSSDPILLDVSTTPGTATAGLDYVVAPSASTVTILAGSTSADNVTVTVIGDDLHEPGPNETFTLEVVQNGASVGEVQTGDNGNAQIVDNEPAPVVTINSPTGVNEGTDIVFTVTLDKPSTQDITVTVSTFDGTAITGGTALLGTADYTPIVNQVVTFSVAEMEGGTLSKPVTVVTLDDNVYEGAIGTSSEQFTLRVVNTTIATGINNEGTGTIVNNDPAPVVVLASSNLAVIEDTEVANIRAIRVLNATVVPIVMTVRFTESIAQLGVDYTVNDVMVVGNEFNVTIAPGSTTSNAAVFDPLPDNIYEAEFIESVTFEIVSVQDGTFNAQIETVVITDSESAPVVNISSPSQLEGTNLVFTVELGAPGNDIVSANSIVLDITTSQAGVGSGFAIEGTDYTANTQQVTIPAGSDNVTFTVTGTTDAVYEDVDEIFTVSGTLVGPASRITAPINSGTGTIEDANDPPVVVLTSDVTNIAEAAGVVTFTATLTGATTSDFPVVIDFGFTGTAINATDYTPSAAQITIPAGFSTGTFTITAVQDLIYENPNETIIVTIDAVTDGTIGMQNQITVTILDDDPAPQVSLSIADASIAEEGAGTTITATIQNGVTSSSDIVMDLGYAGPATFNLLDDDFDVQPFSITILAGQTSANQSLVPFNDDYDEDNELITVSIAGVTGGVSTAPTSVQTTIVDNDDAPNVSLGLSVATIIENGAPNSTSLTATPDVLSEKLITVNLTYTNVTADANDYSGASSIEIAAGAANGSITITALVDNTYEPELNETVDISIASATNGVAAGVTQTLTINAGVQTAPTVVIGAAADVTEGGTLVYPITLTGQQSSEIITVSFARGAGSSAYLVDVTDYSTVLASTTVQIPALSVTNSSIVGLEVVTVDDALYEATETLQVEITAATSTNSGYLFSGPANGNIVDNDLVPSISLAANTTINEDDVANYTVEVSLSAPAGRDIDLAWMLTGTAQGGGVDYSATAQPATFVVGMGGVTPTTATFEIDPLTDLLDEYDETIIVAVTSTTATGTPMQTITLVDVNNPPTVTITVDPAGQADESVTPREVTATLSAVSGKAITINFTVDGTSTATAGADFTTPPSIMIPAGQTVGSADLVVIDDDVWEGGAGSFESVVINVAIPDGLDAQPVGTLVALNNPLANQFTIQIEDNEVTPAIHMAFSTNSVVEDGGISNITFTIVDPADFNSAWTSTAVVTFELVLTGDATKDADYTLAGTDWNDGTQTITIPAGQSSTVLTFTALDDNLFEGGNESAVLIVNNPTNVVIYGGGQNGAVSITEGNAIPLFTIADVESLEGDSPMTFTITSTPPSDEDVTINVVFVDGTAVSGAPTTPGTPDYDNTPQVVTILAGTTTRTFTVPLTNDLVFEQDETFTVTMTSATGTTYDASLLGRFSDTAIGTILNDDVNDDPKPTVTLTGTATIAEDGTGTLITATLSAMSTEDVTVNLAVTGGENAGNALNFDGGDDYVGVPGLNGESFSAVTIETWAYWEGTGTNIGFISARSVAQFELHTGGAVSQGLRFIPVDGVYLDTDNGVFPSNEWVHVACVYDPANGFAAIYINGCEVNITNAGGSPITTPLANSGGEWRMGRRGDGGFPYNGSLDEYRIWNTARTATQIRQSMNTTLAGTESGLMAYYQFNQGVAGGANAGVTTVADGSSNDRNGNATSFGMTGGSSNWVQSTAIADYTMSTYSITIPSGSTTGTATFASVVDDIDEGASEDFTVDIDNVMNGIEGTPNSVVITITDDDDAPLVTIDDAMVLEDAVAGVMTFNVNLSNPSSLDITVNVSTATPGMGSGHAISGTDFTALSTVPVLIPAGATCATVDVAINPDTIDEVNETFQLVINSTLGGPVNGLLTDTGLGTIQDDDATPTVTFDLAAYSATEDSGDPDFTPGSITFAFTLSNPSSEDINIHLETISNTALDGVDYIYRDDVVVFPALLTTGSFTVTFITDNIDEFNETFTLEIYDADGGVGGSGIIIGAADVSTGTITDNDDAPVLTFDAPAVSATETAGVLNFPFTLSNPSSGDITISFTAMGTNTIADIAEAGDFNPVILDVTVNAGDVAGTAVVSIILDAVDEFDEELTISVFGSTVSPAGPNALGGIDTKVGIILDDDDPAAVLLSVLNNNIEEGTSTDFFLTLIGETEKDITVEMGFNNGLPVAVGRADIDADYTITGTTTSAPYTVFIQAGIDQVSFTINAIDETPSLDEINETVFTEILAVTNGVESGVQNQTITIIDNDFPSIVSLSSDATVMEGSDGATNQATITATLNLVSAKDISIDVQVAAASVAIDGVDFGIDVVTINIPAGQFSATTTFTTVADNFDELNEDAVIEIASGVMSGNDIYTSAVNITAGTTSTTTTILDDDNAPTASLTVDITSTPEASAAIITYTVTLTGTAGSSARSNLDVGVDISTGGTATQAMNAVPFGNPIDYTDPSTFLGFSAAEMAGGTTFKTFTVTVNNDDVYEVDIETIEMTIASSPVQMAGINNVAIGTAMVSTDIVNEDLLPNVSWVQDFDTIGENGGVSTITFTQSHYSQLDTEVTLSVDASSTATDLANSTMIDPQDYSITALTLTIPSGALGSPTLVITGVDDLIDEDLFETVVVNVDNVTNGVLVSAAQFTTNIQDDEEGPFVSLTVDVTSIPEEDGVAIITATLEEPSGLPVTINLLGLNLGALAVEDFDFSIVGLGTGDNMIVIQPGDVTGTITLNTIQDFLPEDDVTAEVFISSVTNGRIDLTQDRVAVLIVEDKVAPQGFVVSFITDPIDPVNQANVSFQIADGELPNAYGSATFGYTITDGTNTISVANAGTIDTDPQVISGLDLSSFLAGTVTVTVTLTDIYENQSDPLIPGTSTPIATAQRNYGPNVSLSVDLSTINEENGVAVITATLAAPIALDVTVNLSVGVGAGLGTEDVDFTLGAVGAGDNFILIPANTLTGTITLTSIQDLIPDEDETVQINIASAVNATVSTPNQVNVLLLEDRIAPQDFVVSFVTAPIDPVNQGAVSFQIANGEVGATFGYTITDGTNTISVANAGTIANNPQVISGLDLSSFLAGTVTVTVRLTDIYENISDPANPVGTTVPIATTTRSFGPNVTISVDRIQMFEDGGVAVITATLAQTIALPVTINLVDGLGSANLISDFTLSNGGVITIQAGQLTGTANLVGIGDGIFEGDETAIVRIGSAVNATISLPDQISVLLIEDNIPPSGFTVDFYDQVVNALNQTRIAFDIFGGEVDATYDFTISDGTFTVIGSGLITSASSQRISNIDLSGLNEGTLTLTVILTDQVGNESDPLNPDANTRPIDTILKVPAAQVFPQGLSPNGDGVNDVWILPGIEAFPDNGVTIFNRYGGVVWKIQGYDNITKVFDGSSNASGVNSSAGLPDGTYFYVVTFGSPKQVQKGFIVIRR